MKKQNTAKTQIANGGRPVTVAELKKIITPEFAKINKRFDDHDKRFDAVEKKLVDHDTRFDIIDKRFLAVNIRVDSCERAIAVLEKEMREQFNTFHSAIDAFMKRGEANEREILFLGRQYDDLAKFCTQKIGYPTYGRNL